MNKKGKAVMAMLLATSITGCQTGDVTGRLQGEVEYGDVHQHDLEPFMTHEDEKEDEENDR